MAVDFARVRRVMAPPQRNFLSFATVGHTDPQTGLIPEPTPQFVRIEQGQVWVECTIQPDGDEVVARLAMPGAGIEQAWYVPLEFGCRVVVELVKGNPQNAVITGRFNDALCRFPTIVAGVLTGGAGAVAPQVGVPAPMWHFIKTGPGQLLAVETGPGGDVLLHAGIGGGVHVRAIPPQATHVEGQVHLGPPPTSPPVGATAGPAGTVIPGVPAVPHVPPPSVAPAPAPPGPAIPYAGFLNGIIRARDLYQSDITVDPGFWAFVSALYAHPLIGPVLASAGIVLPLAATSKASGIGGPGSLNTSL